MFTNGRGLNVAFGMLLLLLSVSLGWAADSNEKEIRRLQHEEQRRLREAQKESPARALAPDERRDHREQLGEKARKRFDEADQNGDRSLSRGEAAQSTPRLHEHFDEVDSNRDGSISPDEIRAFRQRMRQRRIERGDSDPRF
ncbi:MAG: hypothetical protein ABIP64_18445 [Burkholderiales bacterium]